MLELMAEIAKVRFSIIQQVLQGLDAGELKRSDASVLSGFGSHGPTHQHPVTTALSPKHLTRSLRIGWWDCFFMDRSDQWTETRLAVTDHSGYLDHSNRGFYISARRFWMSEEFHCKHKVPSRAGYRLSVGRLRGETRHHRLVVPVAAIGLHAPRSGRTTEVDQRIELQRRADSGAHAGTVGHSWRSYLPDSFTTACWGPPASSVCICSAIVSDGVGRVGVCGIRQHQLGCKLCSTASGRR